MINFAFKPYSEHEVVVRISDIISIKKENEQLKQKLEALKELVGEAINERMITEASSYNDWSERETAWTKRAAELLGQTND
jgi:uncharacterized tellurite resistance protein B-like protein